MKRIFTISVALLCMLSGSAQNISGYVRDAQSGETLAGASVVRRGGKGTVANAHGYYTLSVDRTERLTVSFIGYDSRELDIDALRDTIVNISLHPTVTDIETVRIYGTAPLVRFEQLGNMAVNTEQLKAFPLFLGEQDVFKYLQMLPGVTSGKEGSSGLNVRGGSSDQSLILLDDVPLYNQAHTFGFLSIFSGDALKSVDFYKGYIPARYGGRLSSVASMRMRDGNRYEHHQSVTVGTVSAGLTLEGPIVRGKGSYLVSARRFMPDIALWAYNKIKKPEQRISYSFYDVTAKLNYDFGKVGTLSASFYTGNDAFGVDGDQKKEGTKVGSSFGGFSWGNTMASLRLNTPLGGNAFMNNTAYYSRQHNKKEGNAHITDDRKMDYEGSLRSAMDEAGFKSSIEHKISDRYALSYGTVGSIQWFSPRDSYTKLDGDVRRQTYDTKRLATVAAFVENDITFGWLTLGASLRAACYHNGTDGVWSIEPRLSVEARLTERSAAWLSYTRSSQPIMASGLYYFVIPLDFWTPFSGKRLQTAEQFSAGGRYSPFMGLDFTVEAYWKPMKNVALIYDSDDYTAGLGGVDYATGQNYGVEFSAQFNRERYGANLSYTYSRSLRTVGGEQYLGQYDTPHMLNLFARYVTVLRSGLTHTLSMNASYKSGIPLVFSTETYLSGMFYERNGMEPLVGVNNPKWANTRLPDFCRIDLNYSIERKMKRGGVRTWQFSVLNVLNRRNVYVFYRQKDVYTDEVSYKQLVLIPLMPSIAYRRTF